MEFREIAERYDLAKILHSGRSATVFRATDRRSGVPVVVKMIGAGPAPLEEAAVRFEAFAAALAALTMLKHPVLPEVLDSGISSDGNAFLVLEPLEGHRLDTMSGKLDSDAAVAVLGLLGQVLDGLEALAARGLAHGNLAPENLFAIGDPGHTDQVKLLGLGTAAFRGAAAPPDTARFLAPELVQGGVASARSDLYSFARVVCHMLGATTTETTGNLRSIQLPFALTLELANDDALRTILERLLHREPTERPSFREVRAAFRQALGQTAPAPIQAPAPVSIQTTPAPVSAPAPMPAAPIAFTPPPAAPPPEPEVLDGEVLRAITDEVLDALTAPPPPPVSEKLAAAPAPSPPRRRTAALVGALAAVLILAVLVGVWLLRRSNEENAEEAASSAVPLGPVIPPPPSPQVILARLEEARQLLAMGQEDKAREALRDLSFSGQSALPAEACARLADLEGLLGLMDVERLPVDLRHGLETGDLGVLRTAVATGAGLGAALPAELKESFATARHLVELHRLAEADSAEGKHAAVLERMAEMASLSPKLNDPLDLREKSAAAVEGEAEALAREARYDDAVAKLEPLQRTWNGRSGLDARVAGYRGAKEEEARQKTLLDSIPAWERRKKPHEPLEMLRGIKPTPHLAAPIEQARKRLEAQLAQMDQGAPTIELRPGFGLEYSRGNPVQLGFRVRDDYQVRSVEMWAKPPGGKMKEMPLEAHLAGGYWSVELPVSYHQNGTVEFYVQATDLSGHEGWFGTKAQPLKVTRIGSNRV
jgi:serine/threonine protein kinase